MPYSLGMIPTSLNEAKYSSWKCLKPIQLSEIGRWLANIPEEPRFWAFAIHEQVWGSSSGSFMGSPHTHPGFGHVYRSPCHPCAPNYILGKFLAISCRTSHVFTCFTSSGKLAAHGSLLLTGFKVVPVPTSFHFIPIQSEDLQVRI